MLHERRASLLQTFTGLCASNKNMKSTCPGLLLYVLAVLFSGHLLAADENGGRYPVSFTRWQTVDETRARPLAVKIWYPAVDGTPQADMAYENSFLGHAASDAQYRDDGLQRPLIMMSHGDRGGNTNQAWLAETLAANGYIVAAVDHWLNTATNNVPEETARAWHRPADISFVISALLKDETWGPRIDKDRIGAAGHSAGGYTVIALAGAVYDVQRIRSHCASEERSPDCDLVAGADLDSIDYSDSGNSYRDERIKAVFAMAPALGTAIDPDSLRAITLPVHIVSSRTDELLPLALNAGAYHDLIPGAELTLLEGGEGHFVFLSECTDFLKKLLKTSPQDVCGLKSGVDRGPVHERVAKIALDFFGDNL